MTFGTVAILGPGLIGGSLALALAERGLASRLMIYARSPDALEAIRQADIAAELTQDPGEAVRAADIVLLCVPIEAMPGLVREMRDSLQPTALVTDVGSVKGGVIRDLEPLLQGRAHWIGSHPMAGSEQAGFSAARADLFEDAVVIVTPTPSTPPEALQRAEQFWSALGSRVIRLDPDTHDDRVAQISHLPHLLAAALVEYSSASARALAGGGFRDTTRIASGSPELWAEILSSNAEALAHHLDFFIRDLQTLQRALDDPEKETAKSVLLATLKAAHDARSQLPVQRPKRP
jgi:prephenate dehydrogenase